MTDSIQSNEERTMSNIFESWRAGFVRRWHTNPDLAQYHDEIAAHQGRCVVLAIQLFPDASADLLKAIAMHDLAERWVGDLPQEFKANTLDDAAYQHRLAENKVAGRRGFYIQLNSFELNALHLVDKLDAFLFMLKNAPHARSIDDWVMAEESILDTALGLDVRTRVKKILRAALPGSGDSD